MAGLSRLSTFVARGDKDVGARDKPGHDGARGHILEDVCYFDAIAVVSAGKLASNACNVDSVE